MKTSLIFQLRRPSKLAHYPRRITHNFFSSETYTGRSSDRTPQDDGMTTWGCALGIPLCALSKRSLQSLLVWEDALRCGDFRNSPWGAPPLLWLTDQLGKPVPSHNSPGARCSLWSRGFPLILETSQDAQGCLAVAIFHYRRRVGPKTRLSLKNINDIHFSFIRLIKDAQWGFAQRAFFIEQHLIINRTEPHLAEKQNPQIIDYNCCIYLHWEMSGLFNVLPSGSQLIFKALKIEKLLLPSEAIVYI